MLVMVGGKQYEISGIPYGTVPVWQMIKRDGKTMTPAEFNALPDEHKRALAEYAQQYVKDLRGS